MKFRLSLLLSVAIADLLPIPNGGSVASSNGGQPPGCKAVTCVMFCKGGLQKDAHGCDICSCAASPGGVATIAGSCNRDSNGCCSDLGVAFCPDQKTCLSTSANAVIKCPSWGPNNANAPRTQLTSGSSFESDSADAITSPSISLVSQQHTLTQPIRTPQASFVVTGQLPAGQVPAGMTLAGGLTSPSTHQCAPVLCALYCAGGFAKDSHGCSVCACASNPNACPAAQCGDRACPRGFSKDANGCPTCICEAGSVPALQNAVNPPNPIGPIATTAGANVVVKVNPAPAVNAGGETLVALDRPSVAQNPCVTPNGAPAPVCPQGLKCQRAPQTCAPNSVSCPQFRCVHPGKGKAKGKHGKKNSPPP